MEKKKFLKTLKNSLYIVGGLCVIFLLMPGLLQDLPQANLVQIEGTNHFSILFHGNAKRDKAILEFLQ